MDDAPFGLSAGLFVLHQAGIRQLLPAGEALPGEAQLSREPWSSFLAKVPPSPLAVWTYRELGADLSGRANPARGALWRELLRLLELPRGSVGFWPYTLPVGDGGDLVAHLDPFLAGLSRIAPQALVIFGDESDDPVSPALAASPNESLRCLRVLTLRLRADALDAAPETVRNMAETIRLFLAPSLPEQDG